MKFKSTLTAGVLALGLAAAGSAQEIKVNVPGQPEAAAPAAASATPVAPAAPTFTEEQLVEELGWYVARQAGIPELELTKVEFDALLKGLTAGAQGKESPFELEKIGPTMGQYMQRKQTTYMGKLKAKSAAETTAFMTDLKKKTGVVVLPSGLAYEVIKPGDGPAPKPTETVQVNYTGTLVNGTEFDSSAKHGGPAEMPLDQVIPGWTEGLQKIAKGGKIKLYIPPQLGYGDEGRPNIPPASTLVFDVELLDIKPTPPAPPTPAPEAAAPTK